MLSNCKLHSCHFIMYYLIICLILFHYVHTSASPNIIFILTDDQDSVLQGMEPLQKTNKLLKNGGASFTNAFVSTPVCCPSRSSILTGRYIHNLHVFNNTVRGNCSSRSWQQGPEKRGFVTYLKKKNYTTFFAGKYLNQYGKNSVGGVKHIPPGWDWWVGLVGNSRYYNYVLSVNGKKEVHGRNYEKDYLTDLINRHALQFLTKHDVSKSPFFMMLSTPACHAPFTPAPQYKTYFKNSSAPRTPSFNMVSGMDKHWLTRMPPQPLPPEVVDRLDEIFRNRWRTLLSVDDMVGNVVAELEQKGILNNTYIIFSSDHGYHLGQFTLPLDKRQMYEFDIRVPLLVRGPGIATNQTVSFPVVSIDLAPTILDMAGVTIPQQMDGLSFFPLLNTSQSSARKNSSHLHFYKHQTHKISKLAVNSSRGHNTVRYSDNFLQYVTSNDDHPLQTHKNISENHAGFLSWRYHFLVDYHGEGGYSCDDPACFFDSGVSHCSSDFDCKCQDAYNNTYKCVRELSTTRNFIFCQFKDSENFIEAYDLSQDSYQLKNIGYHLNQSTFHYYTKLLQKLSSCQGRGCHEIV